MAVLVFLAASARARLVAPDLGDGGDGLWCLCGCRVLPHEVDALDGRETERERGLAAGVGDGEVALRDDVHSNEHVGIAEVVARDGNHEEVDAVGEEDVDGVDIDGDFARRRDVARHVDGLEAEFVDDAVGYGGDFSPGVPNGGYGLLGLGISRRQ